MRHHGRFPLLHRRRRQHGDSTASPALDFALPSATLTATTAVANGYKDAVKAKKFPIGDTVSAQECDSSVNPTTNLTEHCDTESRITGSVTKGGTVKFSPSGVVVEDGADYKESGSGTCPAGGTTCSIVVSDTSNPSVYAVVPITLAG